MFQIIFTFLVFTFGLCIGSFINALTIRINNGQSIWGRSQCPHCHKQISGQDNVPLLSFIFLRGHCRHCQIKISWQYPLVELISGILFALIFIKITGLINLEALSSHQWWQIIRDWFVVATMVAIFICDFKWYLIFDKITLPAIAITLALNLILSVGIKSLLLGMLIGGIFFAAQFYLSRGRWIGGGDIRLGILIGAVFGWPTTLLVLFLGYFVGSIVSLVLLAVKNKSWKAEVPLGVFLSVAAIFCLFFGERIMSWYLGLVG